MFIFISQVLNVNEYILKEHFLRICKTKLTNSTNKIKDCVFALFAKIERE